MKSSIYNGTISVYKMPYFQFPSIILERYTVFFFKTYLLLFKHYIIFIKKKKKTKEKKRERESYSYFTFIKCIKINILACKKYYFYFMVKKKFIFHISTNNYNNTLHNTLQK